uniref:uncharacterized protein LOC117607064 n=1 Tax=Osmia lignaria TaxID=473952 RepID=UPI0014786774|nr:uncharacterized protein LOC117607064 [Osmia lignaria]
MTPRVTKTTRTRSGLQSIPFRYHVGNTLSETAYVSLRTRERERRGEDGKAKEAEETRERRASYRIEEKRCLGWTKKGTEGRWRLGPGFVVRILIGLVRTIVRGDVLLSRIRRTKRVRGPSRRKEPVERGAEDEERGRLLAIVMQDRGMHGIPAMPRYNSAGTRVPGNTIPDRVHYLRKGFVPLCSPRQLLTSGIPSSEACAIFQDTEIPSKFPPRLPRQHPFLIAR